MQHDTGARHPERADRVRAVHRAVRMAGLVRSADPFPGFAIELGGVEGALGAAVELPYRPAANADLLLCHSAEHVRRVGEVCAAGGGLLDGGDTHVGPRSDELARRAVGAAISAVDAVIEGRVERCFVAGRPPGHHAEPGRAMGFCLYSTVAIAARHAVRRHGLKRVAIVDFDVHHGNGTQACITGDANILFMSVHQHPQTCYPGSGFAWETGVGEGKGLTVNLPVMPGAGDGEYGRVFDEEVIPRLVGFGPELLLISAGFDAHADDPLADMEVSDEGFAAMTRRLADVVPRIVSVLEGGYNLQALGRCVVRHLIELLR